MIPSVFNDLVSRVCYYTVMTVNFDYIQSFRTIHLTQKRSVATASDLSWKRCIHSSVHVEGLWNRHKNSCDECKYPLTSFYQRTNWKWGESLIFGTTEFSTTWDSVFFFEKFGRLTAIWLWWRLSSIFVGCLSYLLDLDWHSECFFWWLDTILLPCINKIVHLPSCLYKPVFSTCWVT